MKRKVRIFIDILMLFFVLILSGYHITGNKLHEVIGVITFILFLLHHILNFNWIKNVIKNKGRGNVKFKFLTFVNLLLLISMVCMMISSVFISSFVFDFLNIMTTSFFRKLHITSTTWSIILISIHLGFHISPLIRRIKEKSQYLKYLSFPIIIIGLYNFIKFRLLGDMLFLTEFKFFGMSENIFLFYFNYLSIVLCISLITNKCIKK